MSAVSVASLKYVFSLGFDRGVKLLDITVGVGIFLSLLSAHCEYISTHIDIYLNGTVTEASSLRVLMLIFKQYVRKH